MRVHALLARILCVSPAVLFVNGEAKIFSS